MTPVLTMTSVALLLAACAQSGQQRSTIGRSTLVIAQQREPRSLNPALENGQSQTEWGELLFSFLVKYDDHAQLVPDVATEVPQPGERRDQCRRAHCNVPSAQERALRRRTPSDGTRLRLVDQRDQQSGESRAVTLRLRSDRVGDGPQRHDTRPSSKRALLAAFNARHGANAFRFLPRHSLAKYPDFNRIDFNTKPMIRGRTSSTAGCTPTASRCTQIPTDSAASRASSIDGALRPDPQTALNLLQTHEVQGYVFEQDYANYPMLIRLQGYRVLNTPVSAVGATIFNTPLPQTSDPRVRHALAEAIDIKSLIAKAYVRAQQRLRRRGLFHLAYDPSSVSRHSVRPGLMRIAQRRGLAFTAEFAGKRRTLAGNGFPLELTMVIQAAITPEMRLIGNSVSQYERARMERESSPKAIQHHPVRCSRRPRRPQSAAKFR